MTPDETNTLIDHAGGNQAFARLLGIDHEPWHQQRITNWRARGLPPAVILKHHDVIRRLQRAAEKGS